MASTVLKPVFVKRTIYSKISDPETMEDYIVDCVGMGSEADLFESPSIATSFYTQGTNAAAAIETAREAHSMAPTKGNLKQVKLKMGEGVVWLNNYADKVEVISNDDANRTSREAAAGNILLSFLTPQKLEKLPKGDPETPELQGKNVGTGKIKVEITNGVTYKPSQTNFIAMELPKEDSDLADPVVELKDGQVKITFSAPGEVITQSTSGKGRFTTLTVTNSGSRYAIYAYAQNGKKQVSQLSEPINVKG